MSTRHRGLAPGFGGSENWYADLVTAPAESKEARKNRVGIVFGGVSTEHEVSVTSATTLFHGLDLHRHVPILVGLDHAGCWWVAEPEAGLRPDNLIGSPAASKCRIALDGSLEFLGEDGKSALSAPLDILAPIIHGRWGEDGTLQGLFELSGLPYVGADVMASALCMDKVLAKRVLRDAGIPVLPGLEHARPSILEDPERVMDEIESQLPYPVFVKPTKTGSSVGVGKARTRGELGQCLKDAARFDHHVLTEPGYDVREIECAVLGGHEPRASLLGEILPDTEFYDYHAKYESPTTQLMIPALLSEELARKIRSLALLAFKATKCWGLARVDFFVERGTDRVFLNELNTLPGFTSGSMYPLLWQASGLELTELINRLLELALERDREKKQLVFRYEG